MSVNHTGLELEGKNPGLHFTQPSFIYIYTINAYILIYVWLYIKVVKQYLFAKLDCILPSNYTVLWPCHICHPSLWSYHSKLLYTAFQNHLSQCWSFPQNLLENITWYSTLCKTFCGICYVSLDWTQLVPTRQYPQQQGAGQLLDLHPLSTALLREVALSTLMD